MEPQISYGIEPDLTVEEFIDILNRSTLAARRPVHDVVLNTANAAKRGPHSHGTNCGSPRWGVAQPDRLCVRHVPFRLGRRRGVSASRHRQGTNSPYARSRRAAHDADPVIRTESRDILPAHRNGETRIVLDTATAVNETARQSAGRCCLHSRFIYAAMAVGRRKRRMMLRPIMPKLARKIEGGAGTDAV